MPSVKWTACFAYAAGAAGILANLLLVGCYALQGTYLGPANDLVGALATAFMMPVAVGLPAIAVLTVAGSLLVLGVLTFNIQATIAVAAWMVLCLWLFLVNQWLRLSGVLRPRVARFGEFLGAGTLTGGAIVGLGFLLPWMSWPQLVVFGVGGFLGVSGMPGSLVWFLLLGRHDGRRCRARWRPTGVGKESQAVNRFVIIPCEWTRAPIRNKEVTVCTRW